MDFFDIKYTLTDMYKFSPHTKDFTAPRKPITMLLRRSPDLNGISERRHTHKLAHPEWAEQDVWPLGELHTKDTEFKREIGAIIWGGVSKGRKGQWK